MNLLFTRKTYLAKSILEFLAMYIYYNQDSCENLGHFPIGPNKQHKNWYCCGLFDRPHFFFCWIMKGNLTIETFLKRFYLKPLFEFQICSNRFDNFLSDTLDFGNTVLFIIMNFLESKLKDI